ncbi:MAG: aldo/keto reductase [Clostridia bacterium]|nr:aldo/keto reductase [Clostridia bacterium]
MNIIEKNGYKISEFTLGTVQLGIPYGINNASGMPSFEESSTILQTALDAGITSFDTAKAYGESEAVLGRFFKESPAEKTLITKVKFDKETKDEVVKSLFDQAKDSCEKMGLAKLPFVMLHNENYVYTYGKTLTDALAELKREGLADNIGISFSDRSKMEEVLSCGVFDHIQIPQNMFDCPELKSGLLKKIGDMGISVFIRSVYLQGLFFRDTNTLPDKLMSAKAPIDKLNAIAERENMSMAQLALSFLKNADGITSLVLGCETPEQLLDSVSKFDTPPMSAAVREEILAISEEIEPVVIKPWEWNK